MRKVLIEVNARTEKKLARYFELVKIIEAEKVVACSFDIESELKLLVEYLGIVFANKVGAK